jgi:hypothetical protein
MRLADQLLAARGTANDRLTAGSISALAADVARAECFELSEDVRNACYQVQRSKPSSIVSALPMARIPYAKTWIEWVGQPNGEDPPSASPCRFGCLYNAPDGDLDAGIMTFVSSPTPGRGGVGVVPYSIYFDWGKRGAERMELFSADLNAALNSDTITAHERVRTMPVAEVAKAMSERWPEYTGLQAERQAAVWLWQHALAVPGPYSLKYLRKSYMRDEDQEQFIASVSSVWPFSMSFIIMLNAKGALSTEKDDLSALNKKRRRLGRRALREFVVTRLNLSKVKANRWPRTWCRTSTAASTPRQSSCRS